MVTYRLKPSARVSVGAPSAGTILSARLNSRVDPVTPDWRAHLPSLAGEMVTLREVELDDAPALHAMLSPNEVARFISPPPTSVEAFERFISWACHQRAEGKSLCFAVVPRGSSTPIGLFHILRLDQNFSTAEWGFAIGSAYWGTGVFVDAATAVIDFAIDTLGVHRLEARAATGNGRGNGALRKLGAVQECLLRRSFIRNDRCFDQVLWSILDSEWREMRSICTRKRRVH
jgi:RimJ/RimL family protein N-acetyltransferase